MRLDVDVAEHHHVLIALDFLEGAGEFLVGVDLVAFEEFLVGAHNAAGRVYQAFAIRVVASPGDQRAHGGFGFLAARLLHLGKALVPGLGAEPINCSIHVHSTNLV